MIFMYFILLKFIRALVALYRAIVQLHSVYVSEMYTI